MLLINTNNSKIPSKGGSGGNYILLWFVHKILISLCAFHALMKFLILYHKPKVRYN